MTALLALTSAALIGFVDFLGGRTSRRAPALLVTLWAQGLGLPVSLVVALAVPADRVTAGDLAWSAAAGVCAALGLVWFYAAMARGLISIAAPLAGVIGAAIPAVYGIATGDELGTASLFGLGLAIGAIFVVSFAPGTRTSSDAGAVIALAVGAGLLFGGFFVVFSLPSEDAGLWPVVGLRVAATATLLVVSLGLRRPVSAGATVIRPASVMALCEVVAGIALLTALQRGPVSIASVLSSLYPVTTVLLAAILLSERMTRTQLGGVALTLVAIVLIST
ncbi:MAG: EamA family transporter [Gaiella sp.]